MSAVDDGPWNMPTLLDDALRLASHWPLLPLHTARKGVCSCTRPACASPGKHPRIRSGRGHELASQDPALIQSWWTTWPNANIGIRTGEASRLLVLDVDPRHGGDQSLHELLDGREMPITVVARTGGGGFHYYFTHPGGRIVGKVGTRPGLDLRADGNFVVAPPAIHASGLPYGWVEGCGPEVVPLAPVPDWLNSLTTPRLPSDSGPTERLSVSGRCHGQAALRRECERVANAPEGKRNDQLNRSAFSLGQLVGGGQLEQHVVEQQLLAACRVCGLETEGEFACMSTISSGLTAGMAQPRQLKGRRGHESGDPGSAEPIDADDNADEIVGDGLEERGSIASHVVRLVQDVEVFRGPDGKVFISPRVDGHVETYGVRAPEAALWLRRRWYAHRRAALPTKALDDALATLEAKGRFDGEERPVELRVAVHGGDIVLDLGQPDWSAVRVNATGWEHLTQGLPVKFRRPRGSGSLPLPTRGGSLELLRPFINIGSREEWFLLVSWMVATLRPRGPYPVLVVNGEQGSAKSTTVRVLKSLLDPGRVTLRAAPHDERDMMIAATNSWILAYDNLSRIPPWLSDALCRLATGGGYATRELYSNDQEALLDVQRPTILNGIEDLQLRGDLLDRAIVLQLPRIADTNRRDEEEFWASFERVRPAILGALLDALSGALRERPNVYLAARPRMADFAFLGAAAASALGWTAAEFMAAYTGARRDAQASTLEGSPIAAAVIEFLGAVHEWRGTTTELLRELDGRSPAERRARAWPTSATVLGTQLARLAPALRSKGLEIERVRTASDRILHLTLGCPDDGVTSVTGVMMTQEGNYRGDERYDSPASEPIGHRHKARLAESLDAHVVVPLRDGSDWCDGSARTASDLSRPTDVVGEPSA